MFLFDVAWDIQHFLNQFWWQINFLLLVTAVGLGYLAYKKPAYGAGLVIILLPTYLLRSKLWFPALSGVEGLPITFLELSIWILFLGWLAKQIVNKNYFLQTASYKLRIYRWPMLLILVAATVSVLIAPDITAAAGLWKAYFVEAVLFFVTLVNIIKNKDDQKIILWSLGISTLSISLLAIYQKFSGFGIFEPSWTGPDHRRVTAFFSSPNAIGLYLGPIIALYLGWLVSDVRYLKDTALKLLIILPAMVAVLLTMSVGTWLALDAAIIFLAFFGWSKKWTTAIVVILVITTLVIPMTRELLIPVITFQDTSGQNRLTLWNVAIQQLGNIKNFFLGLGILGFAQIQNAARDPLKLEPLLYPHNILLNFWTEIGVLGVLAFAWVIIKFFRQGFTKLKEDKWVTLGVMAAMVTILVHGLIDVPYFKNDLAVLFWVIVGLL